MINNLLSCSTEELAQSVARLGTVMERLTKRFRRLSRTKYYMYRGPIKRLKGHLCIGYKRKKCMYVQFTTVGGARPVAEIDEPRNMERLLFGWHRFPSKHFEEQK
ncbi:MAG: hypothetical protein CL489_06260 [Acidobacteria bacterium]|mgnify:CR=1 FL=1|nr:hypothetical protein [Acidobacteriota bacterium]|tara:strand:- start:38536 stop:38850 length:315 start_codon:yes stop_codon:yes gene_type:complete